MDKRIWLVAAVALIGACAGDDDSGERDAGCAIYVDFLAETEDPSDAQAIVALSDVEEATDDPQVRQFALALRSRLEDGEPLGNTFEGLGEACGLTDSSGDP